MHRFRTIIGTIITIITNTINAISAAKIGLNCKLGLGLGEVDVDGVGEGFGVFVFIEDGVVVDDGGVGYVWGIGVTGNGVFVGVGDVCGVEATKSADSIRGG